MQRSARRILYTLLWLWLTVINTRSAEAQIKVTAVDSAGLLAEAALSAYELGTREGREQALSLFLQAGSRYQSVGSRAQAADQYVNVAALHNALGRPDSALRYYERAVADLTDSTRLSAATRQYGEVFHGLGKLDSALAHYARALSIAREARALKEEGGALSNIGVALNALGRPDSASMYLHAALLIRRELGDALGEGVTLNNIATMQQGTGRPDSALAYLRQSLSARKRANDLAGEGTTLNNIGYSFELLQQPDSAARYYREALGALERAGRRSTYGMALGNLGRVFLASAQPDSAQPYLHRGLAVQREVGDRRNAAWMMNDLGRMHAESGRPDSAMHYFADALSALRHVGDRAREGNTLYNIGRFHHRTSPARDLAAAVAYYDSAAALRALVGARTNGDADRVAFIEQDVRLFAEWALAWLAREPELGPEKAAAAALAAAERGRAQALLDLLRKASASKRDTTLPPTADAAAGADLVAEGQRLAHNVARPDQSVLQYLVAEDSLIVWLIDSGGHINAVAVPVGRDSIVALVRAWREDTDAGAGARALQGKDAVRDRDRGLGLGLQSAGNAKAAGAALRDVLIPPALRRLLPTTGELVIVPHGALALMPFAALPIDTAGTVLGSRLALRYAPSLATLIEVEQRPVARTQRATGFAAALVIGNPVMPVVRLPNNETFSLPALPGAEREARWVATRLGAAALLGADATESAVLARLPAAPLVHLATHGFAYNSDARARDSFVALASSAERDGLLTVAEVLEQAPLLSAELVVLSACQTGLGDLKEAEGTVGLQRAFLARGARSVLVSLWNVSDEATETLMKAFYQHWLRDADAPAKAEALRRAQNDVRENAAFAEPRYWAAFQLVGGR